MLLRMPSLLWKCAGDQCPAPRSVFDGEVAANKTGAITHDVEPETARTVAGVGDAASVIGDTESGGISGPHDGEADYGGGAMPTRVIDRFLRDSVEMGRGGGVSNLYLPIGIKGALDVLQTGNGAHQFFEREGKTGLHVHGNQAAGQVARLHDAVVQKFGQFGGDGGFVRHLLLQQVGPQ